MGCHFEINRQSCHSITLCVIGVAAFGVDFSSAAEPVSVPVGESSLPSGDGLARKSLGGRIESTCCGHLCR